MTRRMVDTEIWKKDWFLDLSIKQKLIVKFLYDNCDCAGIYEISYRTLRNCFNQEITKSDLEGIKQIIFISDNKIFIEDFIQFQYGVNIEQLNPNKSNVHKGICKSLKKNGLLTLNEPLAKGSLRVLDKDKDKDKDINKIVINKPTKEEIEEYCKIIGKKINLDDFIAYYDATDWKDDLGQPVIWKRKVLKFAQSYKPEDEEKKKRSEVMDKWYKEQKALLAKRGIY